MKKLIVTLTTLTMLTMSLLSVAAAETVEEVTVTTSNMDADTFLDLRVAQLDEALANGIIDQGC